MRAHCLQVQYDGTEYAGFQIQNNQRTIQGELEKALFKLTSKSIRIAGAGRTDAGVHSEGQTVSFRSQHLSTPTERLPYALNTFLPRDIRVTAGWSVEPGFHASYSALERTYRYQIYESEFPNVFLQRYAYWSKETLDWEAMAVCAELFVGEIDFAAVAASGSSVKTTVRTMSQVEISSVAPLTVIRFTADGFLYKMVRNLAGLLIDVGKGRLTTDKIKTILDSKDRRLASPTAAARGLVLESVKYLDT